MPNATIEIIDFGSDNQRELETSGDKSCSLHQEEGTFVPIFKRRWHPARTRLKRGKNTSRTSTESK